MILEQLMEKKDLLNYINKRIKYIRKVLMQVEHLSKIRPELRSARKDAYKQQIAELKFLRELIVEDNLKRKSDFYYHKVKGQTDGCYYKSRCPQCNPNYLNYKGHKRIGDI